MRLRARDVSIPFEGEPGRFNAITDIPGVEVGQVVVTPSTRLPAQKRSWVRTGVTALLPRGRRDRRPVFAGWSSLNGNGEMTGTAWLAESGLLEGPILSTNTNSVGTVRDAALRWARSHGQPSGRWLLPVVGETWDGVLNDIWGFHVRPEHALQALDRARPGPVAEGNVGGGTGNICYGFKGGIGTASRRLRSPGPYTVGVLVQANHGVRPQLTLAGIPVGRELPEGPAPSTESGSILAFVATDAPLLPHQLERIARRCGLGIARGGSVSGNGSGDLFLAFSTAHRVALASRGLGEFQALPNEELDPLFEATVSATEEAVVNALLAAESMTGVRGHRAEALPIEATLRILARHDRLSDRPPAGPVPGERRRHQRARPAPARGPRRAVRG
jgi:D-aminopeptidase